jgi:hypothetical protein
MTPYDNAKFYGYNSVEEYYEAQKRDDEIFFEGLKRQKPCIEKETVDIQPVRYGRWELTDSPNFKRCSKCGAWWSSDITDNCFTNYCPKCGARMIKSGDTNG